MEPRGTTARFASGLLASAPVALAYFPVAVSFGVAAAKAGFSLPEAAFMSVVIYAGASQFLALALLAGGASPALTVISLLAMNARHLLYAPALLEGLRRLTDFRAPRVTSAAFDAPDATPADFRAPRDTRAAFRPTSDTGAGLRAPSETLADPRAHGETPADWPPTRWSWLWAFGLTDEVFASALGRVAGQRLTWTEAWQTGIGLGAYLAWVGGTTLGAVLGAGAFERWPAIDAGLGFLLPALFLALLLAMFEGRHLPAALAAVAAFALGSALASTSTGILVGMLAGGLAGVLLSARGERPAGPNADGAP